MGSRYDLHDELKLLLGTNHNPGEEDRCYFQPPESIKLSYPCFVYHRAGDDELRANNKVYGHFPKYTLAYITYDPDDPLIDEIEGHFSMCKLTHTSATNGLNHYFYDLFY